MAALAVAVNAVGALTRELRRVEVRGGATHPIRDRRLATVARPRSKPTLCPMSIGQHRCCGSKVSLVNTDRWSLESEACTRVLPGTTAKWWS